jgi:hypothetical protein
MLGAEPTDVTHRASNRFSDAVIIQSQNSKEQLRRSSDAVTQGNDSSPGTPSASASATEAATGANYPSRHYLTLARFLGSFRSFITTFIELSLQPTRFVGRGAGLRQGTRSV